MKDPKKDSENEHRSGRAGLKFFILSIFFSLLPLGHTAFTFPFAGLVGYYRVPYWADGIMGTGLFIFIGAFIGLRKVLGTQKKHRKLKGGEGEPIELEILDRFTYIKLLSGEEDLIEYRYFVKTTLGNWQVAKGKQTLFNKLQPGMLIRAAVVKGETTRKIVDFEILSGTKEETNPALLNQVVDKVASEVKVIGYRDGHFLVNKLHPLKELKYYLVLNNVPLLVTGGAFSQTKLNQKYYEGKERATTLQITVKDKHIYLSLPSGEDGPINYSYYVVSTASTWRLSAHLKDLFPGIAPGASLQIAVVDNCIMDIEFLENSPEIPSKTSGMVMGKVISDVKITSYQNGRYSIKRAKLSYTYRYYLIVNNIPVEVSEADFTRAPYYAFFTGTRKQVVK